MTQIEAHFQPPAPRLKRDSQQRYSAAIQQLRDVLNFETFRPIDTDLFFKENPITNTFFATLVFGGYLQQKGKKNAAYRLTPKFKELTPELVSVTYRQRRQKQNEDKREKLLRALDGPGFIDRENPASDITFKITGAPEWLKLDEKTGQLSGTPPVDHSSAPPVTFGFDFARPDINEVIRNSGPALKAVKKSTSLILPDLKLQIELTADSPAVVRQYQKVLEDVINLFLKKIEE